VARTHAGVNGCCLLAAYLASHGSCLDISLLPGVRHSASETDFSFERRISMAQRLSVGGRNAPIFARPDSRFDSVRVVLGIAAHNQAVPVQVNFRIEWNPHSISVAALEAWLDADATTPWGHPRAGRRVSNWAQRAVVQGVQRPVRRGLPLVERSVE
jgi:hypothetical protein